jgi:hypothetical protein
MPAHLKIITGLSLSLLLLGVSFAGFADAPRSRIDETLDEARIDIRPENTHGFVDTYGEKYGKDYNGQADSTRPWTRLTPPVPPGVHSKPPAKIALGDKPARLEPAPSDALGQ